MRRSLDVEVRPPWPYRLPRRGSGDGTTRVRGGVLTRLLHIGPQPVVVHAWQRPSGEVVFRAAASAGGAGEGVFPRPELSGRKLGDTPESATGPAAGAATKDKLELAIERMRFALGVDENYSEFFARFKRDPIVGPAMRRRSWLRPRRRPWPWEALASAIAGQLIEASRAGEIERRIVRRWGRGVRPEPDSAWIGPGPLRDVPSPVVIAGRAPAELASMDLAPARALAMIRCAGEVASGRVDLERPDEDRRLLAIREIGPWTVQCLGLYGRGDPDSLPAGDLAYVKLVGRLAGLGRRATVPEIEQYFAPYAPYRGLAGTFALTHYHLGVQTGPPLRLAA